MKFNFFPKEAKFLELFEDMGHTIFKAANVLYEFVENWDNIQHPQKIEELNSLEHRGDEITHSTMAQLHNTFVTPFEREDIALLINRLDDILDFIQSAADSLVLYETRPTLRAIELCSLVVKAAAELEKTLPLLRKSSDIKKILPHCIELNRIENEADIIYRSAVGELFAKPVPVDELIKWREIYEQMESATDRCEDVADVLEGVVMKHA